MSRRRNVKSISTPIILGAVSVPLSVALLVGWTLVLGRTISSGDEIALDVWLLIIGALSFLVIVTIIVLLSVFLAREILEVRRQDSFIDSVSHELKSPLASIQLCLETMARADLPDDKRNTLREMMLGDVARLTSFIDDVLQASRLSGGVMGGLSLGDVDVDALLRQLARNAESRHGIEVGTVLVDVQDEMEFRTDEAALEIVLRNLIDNAIKYSPRPPEVKICARREDDRVVFEVRDRGIGIEPQHLKRIFARFFRAPRSDVRQRRGTGLGLFVAAALVRHLGGRVVAESDGLGKGTLMRLSLPAKLPPHLATTTWETT